MTYNFIDIQLIVFNIPLSNEECKDVVTYLSEKYVILVEDSLMRTEKTNKIIEEPFNQNNNAKVSGIEPVLLIF